jgi:hypothetical protein
MYSIDTARFPDGNFEDWRTAFDTAVIGSAGRLPAGIDEIHLHALLRGRPLQRDESFAPREPRGIEKTRRAAASARLEAAEASAPAPSPAVAAAAGATAAGRNKKDGSDAASGADRVTGIRSRVLDLVGRATRGRFGALAGGATTVQSSESGNAAAAESATTGALATKRVGGAKPKPKRKKKRKPKKKKA